MNRWCLSNRYGRDSGVAARQRWVVLAIPIDTQARAWWHSTQHPLLMFHNLLSLGVFQLLCQVTYFAVSVIWPDRVKSIPIQGMKPLRTVDVLSPRLWQAVIWPNECNQPPALLCLYACSADPPLIHLIPQFITLNRHKALTKRPNTAPLLRLLPYSHK